jgi:hypothetical protein
MTRQSKIKNVLSTTGNGNNLDTGTELRYSIRELFHLNLVLIGCVASVTDMEKSYSLLV